MPWYVIQHKPSQGDWALENLQNQDAHCFFPKVTVERIRSGKRTTRLEPLFPGYLFINIDESDPLWSKLRSTRGVLRVVGFGGKPKPVPDEVISYIREGLTEMENQGGLKTGECVQIKDGPFRGMEGIFEAYDGEERAIVLISFLQKQHKIRVNLGDL